MIANKMQQMQHSHGIIEYGPVLTPARVFGSWQKQHDHQGDFGAVLHYK
jgi:hypothetical protein